MSHIFGIDYSRIFQRRLRWNKQMVSFYWEKRSALSGRILSRFILELCHTIWSMHSVYSAYVGWNGKLAMQMVTDTVDKLSLMAQSKGSTLKINISNQAIHVLLRNGQCNADLAARTKLCKMVCAYKVVQYPHYKKINTHINKLFRLMILKKIGNCQNI